MAKNKEKKTFLKLNANQWVAIFALIVMIFMVIGQMIAYF